MTKKIRFLTFVIFLAILFFPLVSSAYEPTYTGCRIDEDTNDCVARTERLVTYEGLVPCGHKVSICKNVVASDVKTRMEEEDETFEEACGNIGGTVEENDSISCQLCHFFVMLNEITNFLLINIVFPVAILLFVVGGALFIFAAGNPSMISQGKSVMTAVAIGLVIIFSSWIIVNTIFQFIGVKDVFKDWDTITCPIELPEP